MYMSHMFEVVFEIPKLALWRGFLSSCGFKQLMAPEKMKQMLHCIYKADLYIATTLKRLYLNEFYEIQSEHLLTLGTKTAKQCINYFD